MKKTKQLTQAEIINAKVNKAVIGLYALSVIALFFVELARAKKEQ